MARRDAKTTEPAKIVERNQDGVASALQDNNETLSKCDNLTFVRETIAIHKIDYPSWLMRRPEDHDPQCVKEMAKSIHEMGMLQDILVMRATTPERYWLIAGMQRVLAKKAAKHSEITARVYPATLGKDAAIRLMFAENERRSVVHSLPKARWFREMMNEDNLSQNALAKRLNIRQSMISDHLTVLDGPEQIRRRVENDEWRFHRALAVIRRAHRLDIPQGEITEHLWLLEASEEIRNKVESKEWSVAEAFNAISTEPKASATTKTTKKNKHRRTQQRISSRNKKRPATIDSDDDALQGNQLFMIVSGYCKKLHGMNLHVAVVSPEGTRPGCFDPRAAVQAAEELLNQLRKNRDEQES
jgi:ParB/RepB/Spo0J family partition protein